MSILDLIDGAIEGWETSPDAMRWRPDAEPPGSAFNAWEDELWVGEVSGRGIITVVPTPPSPDDIWVNIQDLYRRLTSDERRVAYRSEYLGRWTRGQNG